MSYNKMMHAYKKSDQDAIVESDDPHAMIFFMFEELIRAMNKFVVNVEDAEGSPEERAKSLTRALSIIYGLQTSLNFEDGGEIAENLFRLYEFIKNSVLNYKEKIDDLIASIQIVSELYESWCSINSKD